MVKPGEEFVVIVHYRIAECITATKFDEEHKPIDGLALKNARITEVWLWSIETILLELVVCKICIIYIGFIANHTFS